MESKARPVIGYDCNGQPLHVGDPVEFVGGPRAKAERVGERGVVTGPIHDPIVILLYASSGFHGPIVSYEVGHNDRITTAASLKRLDGVGDWHVVESETGWRPKEPVEHEYKGEQ